MGLDVKAVQLIERVSDEEGKKLCSNWETEDQVWCLHELAPIGYRELEPKTGYWRYKILESGNVGGYGRLHAFRELIYEHITGEPYPKVHIYTVESAGQWETWNRAITTYGALGHPFYWLFQCNDSEGYFPPEVCQKIVREMDENPELVKKLRQTAPFPLVEGVEPSGWHALEQCFRLAAKVGGVVCFR